MIDKDANGTHEPEEIKDYLEKTGCHKEDVDCFIKDQYQGKSIGLAEFKEIFKNLCVIQKESIVMKGKLKGIVSKNIVGNDENTNANTNANAKVEDTNPKSDNENKIAVELDVSNMEDNVEKKDDE